MNSRDDAAPVLLEELPARYVVGIDLGTTNSAVCYVDCHEHPWRVRVLEIPQFVAPGVVESRDTLPSFHYQLAGEGSGFRVQGSAEEPGVRRQEAGGEIRNPQSELPNSHVVGFMARDEGGAAPGRLIASAKSWLSHAGVDRTGELLPWHAAPDVERISPVEASSRYLAHIRAAWNAKQKSDPLERQDIVLTLPASFDEIARELTVEAAARAGLARVVLIEEPQAAFYAWIYKHRDNWEQLVSPGQKILVCDIGGGTTDFTLIRVRKSDGTPTRRASEGRADAASVASGGSRPPLANRSLPPLADADADRIQFHRVAVGDHLILGGDNMDLALAKHLEERLSGRHDLQPRQWEALLRLARQAKEKLLAGEAPEQLTITLPGSGSKLIGGSLSVTVKRDEVRELLVEGFFPRVTLAEKPATRRSGFQEFGLPYAADPAMTRHLAGFLTAHRFAGEERVQGSEFEVQKRVDPARPDVVLFNGGVFDSPVLRQRLLDSMAAWFGAAGWKPALLDNDRLDLAVARGAAYYGMVRRGEGVRIVASLARTYYIGIESAGQKASGGREPPEATDAASSIQRNATEGVPYSAAALCLVPGSAEPGQDIEMPGRQFDLLVSEPVEFPLFTSSVRLTDQPGELVPVDPEQMTALPPIRTALKTRTRKERGTVPVHLHARLTEIGTLELWCQEVGGERKWKLQFDVRSATQTDRDAHETAAEAQGFVDEGVALQIAGVLERTFGSAATSTQRNATEGVPYSAGGDDPGGLIKRLVAAAGERSDWPTSLLRRIWEKLMELESGRRKSAQHEARWLNLLGYALRPGFGLAVDDWRVAETWKTVQGKLAFAAPSSRTESLILWRRIAGGLTQGQQRALAQPLLATVRTLHKRQTSGSGKGADPTFSPHETLEVLRLLGSLELLPVETKIELGDMLTELAAKKKLEPIRSALWWALARLGAREPLYGPLNTVVPPDAAERWLERLLATSGQDAMLQFALVNVGRRTGDRFRDVDEAVRGRLVAWLAERGAAEHAMLLVREGGQLDADEQSRVFGESLPLGLRLR